MRRKSNLPSPETLPLLEVRMLGGLQITLGEKTLTDSASRSLMIWSLLGYLIVHRDRNVPQDELIHLLWPQNPIDNPANALKTLLFRVRAVLASSFGPEIPFIVSQRGAYAWNKALPCWLDAEEFSALLGQAGDKRLGAARKLEIYRKAVELYQGDFLPKLSSKSWVVPLTARYHAMYLHMVLDYGRLLLEKEAFPEAVAMLRHAVQLEPYDEHLHGLLITALMRQGQNTAALNQYEAATDLLYRNLGVRPSEKLRALYQEIMREQKNLETDLGLIQRDLQENAAQEGAFVCEYGFFREAYRLEARRAARQGSCVHIALLTVSLQDGGVPDLAQLGYAMDQLLEILKKGLRKGDVVARYSGAQYVVMLPTANYENGIRVIDRVVKAFEQQNRRNSLRLGYELRQLDLTGAREAI